MKLPGLGSRSVGLLKLEDMPAELRPGHTAHAPSLPSDAEAVHLLMDWGWPLLMLLIGAIMVVAAAPFIASGCRWCWLKREQWYQALGGSTSLYPVVKLSRSELELGVQISNVRLSPQNDRDKKHALSSGLCSSLNMLGEYLPCSCDEVRP